LATVFEGMRNQMSDELTAQNLDELSAELLGKARGARSGRAARGVFNGTYLRQVLLTLTEGSELADHDSPPAASLQVIEGRVRLATATESWELSTRDLIAGPPERNSVAALSDAAFMLTIRTEVTGGYMSRKCSWSTICGGMPVGGPRGTRTPDPLGVNEML